MVLGHSFSVEWTAVSPVNVVDRPESVVVSVEQSIGAENLGHAFDIVDEIVKDNGESAKNIRIVIKVDVDY